MEQYTNPKIWGPHFWFMLRCITYNYPISPTKDEAAHMKKYFDELQYILPCEKCKYTFKQHYAKYPIDKYLSTKDRLIEWIEIMYQETAKSIKNNRVKIIDNPSSDMLLLKTKKKGSDDLEKKLKEARLSVVSAIKTEQGLQMPQKATTPYPLLMGTSYRVKEAKTFEPKKYLLKNVDTGFEKTSGVKKLGGRNIQTIVEESNEDYLKRLQRLVPDKFKNAQIFAPQVTQPAYRALTEGDKSSPYIPPKTSIQSYRVPKTLAQIKTVTEIDKSSSFGPSKTSIQSYRVPQLTIPKLPLMQNGARGLTVISKCDCKK